MHDLIVIGAGPAGLEMALEAQERGWDVVVLERGRVAENVRRWGFVRLFTPWSMNLAKHQQAQNLDGEATPLGRELAEALQAAASKIGDRLLTDVTVTSIGRRGALKHELIGDPARASLPFLVLAEDADGSERRFESRAVVDASGTYGNHRWLGQGGLPALGERKATRITYTPQPLDEVSPGRLAIVGAGYSACTMLEQLHERGGAGCRVTWVTAESAPPVTIDDEDPLPYRKQLGQLANALSVEPPSWLTPHHGVSVEATQQAEEIVTLRLSNGTEIEADRVLAMVGYKPDAELYAELQVHQCYATQGPMKLAASLLSQSGGDCLTLETGGPETLQNPEPGFFIIGAKSYGRNSQFLLQRIDEQVRDVSGLLAEHFARLTV